MLSSLPLPPATHADRELSPLCVCFSVQARAETGVMPRVVELFAKRGLVPHKWHSTVSGEALMIDVQIGGLGRDLSGYIARSMRQIVGVETVLTSETRASL
ncbi:MAG: hypothetical protein WA459_00275 [Stellaceae bacterium]